MAGAIPDIIIRLVADVDDFIRDWERAADAAERAAARIRAAGAAAGNGPGGGGNDDTTRRMRELNAELDRMTRAARAAADAIRDHGNSSRRAGEDVESLRRRLNELENGLGRVGSAGSSASGGMGMMGKVILVLASLLPGVIAGLFALGAAAVGVAAAAGVMALGAKGLGQAFDGLERTIQPLKRQLDSVFRAQLSQEMIKLGQTISTQLAPSFKEVAKAISEVIKSTSEWIRSAEGISTIKTMMGGVADLVRELGPAVKGIVQIFVEFGAAAAPAMGKIGQAISEVVVGLRDMFREAQKSGQLQRIFEAGAEAIKGFGEIIKGVMMILMEMADQGGKPAAEAMKDLGKAMQNAAPAIGAVFKGLAQAAQAIAKVIEFVSRLGEVFKGTGGDIGAFVAKFVALGPVLGAIIAPIKIIADLFPKAAKEIDNFAKNVKKGLDKAAQDIAKFVSKAGMDIAKWATKLVTDAKQAVDKFAASVKQGFDKANQSVKQSMDKVNQSIKQGWDKAVASVKQSVDKIAAAIKQGFDKANQELKQAVDKMVQAVTEWWDKTVADVSAGVDKAKQALKDGLDKILADLKGFTDQFVQAGAEMVMGLVKGAKAKVDELVKLFKEMAEKALAAAKAALGIHSPSRLFADEVGVHIPAGIAQGITAGTPALQAALARSMRTLPVTANVALAGAAGRGAAIGASSTGKQVIEVKLSTGSGGDGAVGTMIGGLARRGQLKITANAVVGGRK